MEGFAMILGAFVIGCIFVAVLSLTRLVAQILLCLNYVISLILLFLVVRATDGSLPYCIAVSIGFGIWAGIWSIPLMPYVMREGKQEASRERDQSDKQRP